MTARPEPGCGRWPTRTRITERHPRTGHERARVVVATLPEVERRLAEADGGQVFFGEFRNSVAVHAEHVIGLEPYETLPPRLPTTAELVATARHAERRQHLEARRRAEHRAACRGGTEIILLGPEGRYVRQLARPVDDVFIEVAFAHKDAMSMDDGLGGAATLRRCHVVSLRRCH